MSIILLPKRLKTVDGSMFVHDQMERSFVYPENNEPEALCFAVKKGDNSYLVFIHVAKNKIKIFYSLIK